MWASSSGEHSRAIDKLPEEIMSLYSPDFLRAEIKYRQDRIKRDYQRPLWFHRKPKREVPEPCAPELRARPAM
jgi:hypothetical protein